MKKSFRPLFFPFPLFAFFWINRLPYLLLSKRCFYSGHYQEPAQCLKVFTRTSAFQQQAVFFIVLECFIFFAFLLLFWFLYIYIYIKKQYIFTAYKNILQLFSQTHQRSKNPALSSARYTLALWIPVHQEAATLIRLQDKYRYTRHGHLKAS